MSSYRFTIDFDPGISTVIITAVGKVGHTEIMEAVQQAFSAHPAENGIWNLCDADLSELDHHTLRQIIEEAKSVNRRRKSGARTALVTNREDSRALLSLFRALNQYAPSHIEYRVFASIEDAKRWIADR